MVRNFLSSCKLPPVSERLFRNIGWLAGAEMVSRIGRIVAAIVLARTLDVVAFGVAAIAVTIFELMRIFTENGIGAAVIRAPADKLKATTNTAYRFMWGVCLFLAVGQVCVGFVVQSLFPQTQLGWMIGVLAGVYLIMPFGLVHAYLLQRQERMKRLAIVATSQTLADHILTAGLAIAGFGAWAIILPKLLTAPIWLFGVRKGRPWQRDRTAGYRPLRQVLFFSLPVLGAELAAAAREQCDKLIVSVCFGLEVLGLYYFAFNAGLGLSTSLNRAFNGALYPNLCAGTRCSEDVTKRFQNAFMIAGLPLCSCYIVQAIAALFYVPIIFGSDWAHAAPLVALLCLGGPARLLIDALRVRYRAAGQPAREFSYSLIFAGLSLAPLALLASYGLFPAIVATIICTTITSLTLLGLTIWRPRKIVRSRSCEVAL